MKIALIQDSLLICAGSERVFKCMAEEFFEADIFTLAYNEKSTCSVFKKYKIKTSWLNFIIRSHDIFKLFFPISTYVMQYWNFNKYDIIISSSATTAKYISKFRGKHFCFGYFPTRAIWDYNRYFVNKNLKSFIFRLFLPSLKNRDLKAVKNITTMIAQSHVSKKAFQQIYNIDTPIIHSPIEYEKFKFGLKEKKSDHYLIVSRLEQWKKLEYAIEAFNKLGLPLDIIGGGPLENELKNQSKGNIRFLGRVSDKELIKHYGKAKALIFTPSLEYGLPPLEALASGTPVIAFGEGAVNETMVPHIPNSDKFCTAVFFDSQKEDSLINAIKVFNGLSFKRDELSKYAAGFSEENFRRKLRDFVILNR